MRDKTTTTLIDVICDGSMKAAVEIADRKGILKSIDPKTICEALKIEIRNGYELAVRDAKDALATGVGQQWLRATLSASCVSFAQNALIRCGYLQEGA